MFQLSKDEVEILRTKISSTNYSAQSRSLPYAFTEKGLYMLATILKSKTAINTTFAIIETFAAVRELKRELVELHKEGDKFRCQGCRKPASDYTKLGYRLADKLSIKGLDRSMLNVCRLFYIKYPQICATVSHKFETPPELLVTRLSFSHIKEIMPIEDPIERFFYELECIKGTWNVRELRRQIGRGEK